MRAIALAFTITLSSPAGEDKWTPPFPGPPELGMVHWSRDLDATLARARKTGKPVLVLFQEVPG